MTLVLNFHSPSAMKPNFCHKPPETNERNENDVHLLLIAAIDLCSQLFECKSR